MRALTVSAVAVLALAATTAYAADAPKPERNCFPSNSWQGWSAPGDSDFLLLRVSGTDIWRVDLTPGVHVNKSPNRFLVNEMRGSTWICSAIDLDLTLSDRDGFRQPLIAKSLRKMTPEEIAVVPPKDLP
ncbi:MAG: hypothetical protein Q8M88_01045 [Phenylobacterium sp.]|uniref:hypothetical protein n=1 Tax=Phenylobacterium sp. TaxID=1871053 RepID=UPI00273733C5|nr:hypothetical protein [Phenylobacterium sp.]MDP3173004.1 hypothetical protein [Phenylobacterium sp.]